MFIGRGLRTNQIAIHEMLENDVFGDDVKEVVVVKDEWQQQQEMHLDTYFNIASPNTAVLVEDRFPEHDCGFARKCLNADVWERKDNCSSGTQKGPYCLTTDNTDKEFTNVLSDADFTNIIPVSVKDRELYGVNFLTVEGGKIIGVDSVSEAYKSALARAGVSATWIDFDNMKLGYGAAHCTTQVLSRAAE